MANKRMVVFIVPESPDPEQDAKNREVMVQMHAMGEALGAAGSKLVYTTMSEAIENVDKVLIPY